MTSLGFDTGLALTQRPSGGAAGPVAPIPANMRFLIYGDSRTADGKRKGLRPCLMNLKIFPPRRVVVAPLKVTVAAFWVVTGDFRFDCHVHGVVLGGEFFGYF